MAGTVLILDYIMHEREKIKHIAGSIGDFNFVELSNINEFNIGILSSPYLSLIIMDIEFPLAADGLNILSSIRETGKGSRIPVIIITKSDKQEHKSAASKYKVNDYIIKPYNSRRLEDSISTLVQTEKPFKYNTNCINDFTISFDSYFTKQIKFADRMSLPLSIILFSTINTQSESSDNESRPSPCLEQICSIIEPGLHHILRETDNTFLNNGKDILVVLPGTGLSGARSVEEKVKKYINTILENNGVKFSNCFCSACAAFPDDGKDFQALIKCIFNRISDKELLEKMASIPIDTRKYANKRYSQFNRWF